MSGLCGIFRFDGSPVADQDLQRQMQAMAGRGPDRARRWRSGSVGLGSLLMRVTHEDIFDAQPLRDAARDLTLVCDARLDNREELAAALDIDPEALAVMADSALLFAAYKAWGADCAERLIGDFAFAVWDGKAQTLTLGRDHMGQRHIFLHAGDGFFAFATERKGMLALPDVPRILPTDRLARVLVQAHQVPLLPVFNPAPRDGLGHVLGGTVITVGPDGAISEHRYWTPHAAPEHLDRDEAYYIETYRRVLAEAVACRVRRATAPVGLLMGGGFDSGAIAALAGPALQPSGRKLIAAASVSAQEGTRLDARRWVEACGRHMPHLDVRYVTEVAADPLAGLDRAFYEAGGTLSSTRFIGDALFTVIKAAGARVVMDGHGGDYTLNCRGNGYFFDRLRRRRIRGLASEWRARRRVLGWSHRTMFTSEILSYAVPAVMRRWQRWRKGLAPFGPTMPVADTFLKQAQANGIHPHRPWGWGSIRGGMMTVLRAQQGAKMGGWAPVANSYGLEFTQPFHDKRVVELAVAIPEDYFLRNGRERHLARQALKDLYPPEFQTRRDGNDALQPDFMDMAARLRPTLMTEIDRMERSGKLSAYLDFPKMRRMLNQTKPGRPGEHYEYATRSALNAFIRGRYIEWFTRGNW